MASAASSLSRDGNERFSAEAAAWDKNPLVHEASLQAYKALQLRHPALKLTPVAGEGLDVLEIGCGTGLLSFLVAPHVHQIVAVDAANGMIEVLNRKISQIDAPKNILPVAVLLTDPEDRNLPPADASNPDGPRLKFDLITSHLVLHHIPQLEPVLKVMFDCLKPGGSIALTDFEDFGPEAKRFHPQSKMAGVERHGIHPETISRMMRDAGFSNVHIDRAWTMKKQVEKFEGEFGSRNYGIEGEGEMMDFPFIVCAGERM